MRSAVSRTAKGYSVEATLDISEGDTVLPGGALLQINSKEAVVDELSAFQIAKLREHMKALGEAFPRNEEDA